MKPLKVVKDYLNKLLQGPNVIPKGMFDMSEYFRHNGPINFEFKKENGLIIALSTNFREGTIIAQGATPQEVDSNIKDAILTSFEVPSAYVKKNSIHRVGEQQSTYALA